MEKIFKKKSLIVFLLFFLFSTKSVFAQKSASLFLSPASGSFQVGESFSVTLAVKSEEQPTNAAEAILRFDSNFIRVKSISKTNSIFTLWPVEPTFSNTAGTINFVGGSPTAYKGSMGRIITITFEVLKEGTASINISQGRVLAADGLGTDITDKLLGGSYTLVSRAAPTPTPTPTPTPSPLLPSAPKISSPTHPDPEKWYNNNSPRFEWQVPAGVTEVKLAYGKNLNLIPAVSYSPAISSKQLESVEDGVWYFAAQFKNDQGWGGVGRYKFQIDTTPPKEFTVLVDNEGDPKNPTPIFKFQTTDETSGVDYYEIILNGNTFAKIKPEEIKDSGWRPTNPLEPGDYTLEVKAFDRAGNFTIGSNYFERTITSLSFTIEPIPFEILSLPKKIKEGMPLIIEGRTIANGKVFIYFQKGEEEINTREINADGNGYFKFEEKLPLGKYLFWFQVQDLFGRKGPATEKYSVEIVKERIIFYISILLTVLILIGLAILFYLLRKLLKEKERKRIEEEKKKKEFKLKAYSILKQGVENQIKTLEEKTDLSRSETRILEALRKALKEAEDFIKEELEEK